MNGSAIYIEQSQSPWDFVCGAVIEAIQPIPNEYKWSASIWYTDQGEKAGYRWIEVSYWMFQGQGFENNTPFALEDLSLAIQVHSPGMHNINLATRPKPIDDEATDDFIERWSKILADAYEGTLRHPTRLPLE